MSLIVHNGTVLSGTGIEQLVSYGNMLKLRTLTVEIWGFENLPYGQLAVNWSNGAHGSCIADSLIVLKERAGAVQDWPRAVLHSRALPYSAGCAYRDSFAPIVIPPEDPTPDYAALRVVRQRSVPVEVRRVRVRASQ